MPVLLQEGRLLHARGACSQIQKGMFTNTEGHVLKCRKACSQIQKGPFFFFNTHALHSCGGKTNLHQDKILLPLTCLPFSPPVSPSSPNPHPSHPHPTHLPFSAHTPSAPIPLPFCPQPALFPSPTHSPSVRSPLSPLRYSPNLFICYPVFYYKQHIPLSTRSPVHLPHSPVSSRIQLVHSSPRQLVNLPVTHRTCSSVTLSPLTTNLFTRPPVNSSTYNVTHRTCSSVTLSPLATNLFPCPLLNSSTYNVTLRTCSPVTMSINTTNLFPCPLVNPSSCKLFLSSYFFVGTCPKHCNANSSLFVTHFYRQNNNYQ